MPFGPHDAAVHAVGRARALLLASRSFQSSSVAGDMRRLSVVMAVAALDTYMHRLIIERAFTHEELPGGLARLELPFKELLAQADAAGAAARAEPHNSRPRVSVKRHLRDRLLRETFQRFDDVSRALGMAGRSGNWDAIGQLLNPPLTTSGIRQRLDQIVTRRNQIVHEGDYQRLERPQTARRNGLNYSRARADVEFIAQLIDCIHGV